MIFNHFKIILRHLAKNRVFSLINLFGLTLGFLCFILIGLYIHDELNYDMFHPDADRIVRVLQHETLESGEVRNVAPVAARIAPEVMKQFPEVEDVMRITGIGRITLGNDPADRDYEDIILTDTNFFTFFNFKLKRGDPASALVPPNAVVMSESLAQKYFGSESAFGKTILANGKDMTITGIMEDFPTNSSIQLDMIFSESTWISQYKEYNDYINSDWSSNNFTTFIKLKPGAEFKDVSDKITDLVKANYPADKTFRSEFSLQPLGSIHLYSDHIQGAGNNGIKPFYLYMFAAVAFLILLIACLNYMNLSTALAFKRTREIGTRKTLGAGKGHLILQFLGEAFLLSLLSLCLAIGLVQFILPWVNDFTNKEMLIPAIPIQWAAATGTFMLIIGMLSALYPAFIVSKVSPVEAIKNEIKIANRSVPVRKILVVGQFAIAIVMISSTLIIYRQLRFMRGTELGFNNENLITIDINSGALRNNFEAIKNEFGSLPEVKHACVSSRVPGEWKNFPIAKVHATGEPLEQDMIYVGVDHDFLSTYNIPLREGRNFSNNPGDSTKIVLTQFAVEQLGLSDPVGQVIEIPSVRWGGSIATMEKPFVAEVIGVVDNFYFESFRSKMMPLVFAYHNNPIHAIDYYTLQVNTSNWNETLSKLKDISYKFDTENPLEYTFLEGRFEEMYTADERRGQVFFIFSLIIVIIASLGLFALVSFSIQRRKKEIGLRKVMGASVRNIVELVSREFLVLIIIACTIAVPFTYLLMKNWLEDFAYHIKMSAGIFITSGILSIVIALVTICFRTIRAALANPVDSLRNE